MDHTQEINPNTQEINPNINVPALILIEKK
jgi:hypothetical protein